MAHFTVIGLYEGSLQRFAQTFEAWDQEAAQVLAMHEFPRLLVAGVVEARWPRSTTRRAATRRADGAPSMPGTPRPWETRERPVS